MFLLNLKKKRLKIGQRIYFVFKNTDPTKDTDKNKYYVFGNEEDIVCEIGRKGFYIKTPLNRLRFFTKFTDDCWFTSFEEAQIKANKLNEV